MVDAVVNTPQAWSFRAAAASSSWEAGGWSERGQVARFQAVLDHLELRAGDSLLDFGAGTGRFCSFVPDDVDYFAFDTAGGMRFRTSVEHERATVLSEIPDRLFDHVVAVGCFNLPGSVEETFAQISELWHMSTRRSLIVSLYRGDDPRCLRYEPATLAVWAKVLGARRFVIDGSHLDNDLILAVYR